MSEADLTRAVILEGAEKAAEAAAMIERTRVTGNDIGAQLNRTKAAVLQTLRETLTDIMALRDARDIVSPFIAGSGQGYVAKGVQLIDRADQELQETARSLKFLQTEIERWQREIVPVIDRDLTEQANNTRGAAGEFRAYANVL